MTEATFVGHGVTTASLVKTRIVPPFEVIWSFGVEEHGASRTPIDLYAPYRERNAHSPIVRHVGHVACF